MNTLGKYIAAIMFYTSLWFDGDDAVHAIACGLIYFVLSTYNKNHD
jgi:hypothetical protein